MGEVTCCFRDSESEIDVSWLTRGEEGGAWEFMLKSPTSISPYAPWPWPWPCTVYDSNAY